MSKVFGQNLRAKRIEEGLTIAQCATEFNITAAAWNFWELGSREPKFDVLQAICARFKCTSDDLLGLDRGSSAAVVVNGSGNAVANGAHARASVTIGNAGEAPPCKKCKYLKAIKKLEKAGLQLPEE